MSKEKGSSAQKSATFRQDQEGFPIVGIGASAGGLEAFEKFFANMPPDSDIAFVMVQHLDPTRESMLTEILRNYTEMPVYQIEHNMKVERNAVYVISPNTTLSISDGVLQTMKPEQPRGRRLPIDIFFRSLAQDQREKAICIILSGTGTDGSLGLKAVKEYGGLCIVQQESSAKYEDMPRSAVATGLVDYVLPVEEMPQKLIEYARHPTFERRVKESIAAIPDNLDVHLKDIFRLVRAHTGHDFSLYKRNTILRRIARRISVRQLNGMADYVGFLQKNASEIEALFKELLIGVTNFFRDPEAFAALEQKLIPQILGKNKADGMVRVWVPGCSTGEEAYSIAILLAEQIGANRLDMSVQIFATDIDEEALSVARMGLYPESIAADVSEARLDRFFTKDGNMYQVSKQLREMIIFAPHNLIKDPPFSRLDLLSCRNVLIYLGPELQKRLMPLFHYTLRRDGFLFLGTSENIGASRDLFAVVDKKWRLFQRKGVALRRDAIIPIMYSEAGQPLLGQGQTADDQEGWNLGKIARNNLLDLYAPACVIINTNQDIVHYHGRTGKYLEPSTGEPSHNILKMARQGLRSELRRAILRATRTNESVIREHVAVKTNGEKQLINLVVHPISQPEAAQGLVLVAFEEAVEAAEEVSAGREIPDSADPVVHQLESELKETKEDLQSTIEELETSNEELKSANEELLSVNEELQSTNEELETSKEELQSVNEELVTVNTELQTKVEELAQANSDINNLLVSTEIPTIILNRNLQIKRFTPSAGELFNLIPTDVDRPFSHISHNLRYDTLMEDIESVLDTLIHQEKEVQTHEDSWYLMRILPYRTVDNVIDGVILTFANVTAFKEVEEKLEQRYEQLQTLYRMTEAVSRAGELKEIYEEALNGLQAALRADRVSLSCLDDEGKVQLQAWRGVGKTLRRAIKTYLPWDEDQDHPRPVLVTNVEDSTVPEALRETILQEDIHAIAVVPLLYEEHLLGSLMIYYDTSHSFTEEEVQLAQMIAGNVSFAIERQRAREELKAAHSDLEARVEKRTALLKQQVVQRKAIEGALRKERDRVKFLQEVAVAANEASSVVEVYRFALSHICEYTGWPLGHAYYLSADGELRSSDIWHCDEDERLVGFKEVTAKTRLEIDTSWIGKVVTDHQAIWAEDLRKISEFQRNKNIKELGVTAGFAFPVLVGTEVVGILEFFSFQSQEPDEELLQIMDHIGTQLGRVVERQRSEEKIAQTAQQLAVLNEMGQVVVASLELEVVLERVLNSLRPLLHAEGVFILLCEEEGILRFAAASEGGLGNLTGQQVPATEGIAGKVLQNSQPQWVWGDEVPRRVYKQIEQLAHYTPQAIIATPLRFQDEVIGVMEAVHSQPHAFEAGDLAVLNTAAAWASIAIGNARLYEEVQNGQARLRELAEQLVNTQEEERWRVSRELHDEAGQALAALKINLEMMQNEFAGTPAISQQLQRAGTLTAETMERIRVLAYDLRPPELDTIGLDAALKDLCQEFIQHSPLRINYKGVELPPDVPDVVHLAFYRFLQESLTNVVKHAEAGRVEVQLAYKDEAIYLTVSDNGRGFDPSLQQLQEMDSRGLGLLGVKERFRRLNGTLAITSAEEEGATLVASVPWQAT